MRSSIYFLLALISSPALAAPTFVLKREGENGQTTGFDPSRFRIGTVVSSLNPLFDLGPEIPNFGSHPPGTELRRMLKSRTSNRALALPGLGPVVWEGDHSEYLPIELGPELLNSRASKRAAQDLLDEWSNFVNAFAADHPNSVFSRDTSDQDRWAQLLDDFRNSHDIFMRDAGDQALWDLLIKGAQAQ